MDSQAAPGLPPARSVLVTGATGYVGGRVVPALLGEGVSVRCLARTPAKLDAAPWRDRVEVAAGPVAHLPDGALAGVDVALYLVHSIGQGPGWAERERADAVAFADAARSAGVARIVYLGGLGRDEDRLSRHLRSRHDVGAALAAAVPTVELRAGVIIGSGSASFEMLRYLVEVLPLMVTPRWVSTRCQPVSIADVVTTVVRAATDPTVPTGVHELGGPDVVSYAEMMATYARVAGLPRRRLVAVPFLSPRLSSHWVGLVTPVPVPLARELVESLVNEVTVDPAHATTFGTAPMGLAEAIERALVAVEEERVPTTFRDADLVHFAPAATDPDWAGGTILSDVRRARSSAPPERVFATVCGIGGDKGWYAGSVLWHVRGLMDKLLGGPGLRKGRKRTIAVGDAIDFWRVEELVADRRLRLRAEMVLPGRAWLTWDLEPADGGGTALTQTATFRPRGLLGRAYWLGVAPFHRFVFPGLLAGIVADAERRLAR